MLPRSAPTTAAMALLALLVWTEATTASVDGIWVSLAPDGPAAREGHVMIYDAGRDRIIIHGGATTISNRFDDVWAYPLTTDGPWEKLTPAGTAPSGRAYHSAIYDPIAERMVIFGGLGGGALSDVWALNLDGSPEWHPLTPSGTAPSARYWHSAVYVPSSHRMIVYGGAGSGAEVFELDLTEGAEAWLPPMSPSGPAARCCHEAVFSVASSSMIMFGGWNGDELGDLWSLSGTPTAWSALNATGPGRTDHVAALDASRNRVIVHGGIQGTTTLADAWAAPLNAPYAWSLLTPAGVAPDARAEHAAVYDPLRDRMILFGGRALGWKGDLWALDFRGTSGVPGPPSSALGLALHRIWHSADALHLDMTAATGRVRIELMDVAGRRILARAADVSTSARQDVAVPCDIACGIYFVRVSQGMARAGGRVAVVEH